MPKSDFHNVYCSGSTEILEQAKSFYRYTFPVRSHVHKGPLFQDIYASGLHSLNLIYVA